MAVAVVERFKQELMYGLSAGTKKSGRCGEVAVSGGSTVKTVARCFCTNRTSLRTVPTFVTARTFCASRDTQVSYGWCLVIQGYFCAV